MGVYQCPNCNGTVYTIIVDKRKFVMYIRCWACGEQTEDLEWKENKAHEDLRSRSKDGSNKEPW